MRKICGVIFTSLFVILLSFTAMASTTITVNGTGEALVPADVAIISLGVSARDADVLNAQEKVNETIAAIRSSLIENGVAREDINTDYINVYAIYDYAEEQEKVVAYNAYSTLAVKTLDMDRVGEIIDLALGAGANNLNGVNFSATDTGEAKQAALIQAMLDASSKAAVLANAAGVVIMGIDSIEETGTYSYDGGAANNFSVKTEAASDAEAGTYVQAAQLTVTANVSITYVAATPVG